MPHLSHVMSNLLDLIPSNKIEYLIDEDNLKTYNNEDWYLIISLGFF